MLPRLNVTIDVRRRTASESARCKLRPAAPLLLCGERAAALLLAKSGGVLEAATVVEGGDCGCNFAAVG